MTNSFILLLLLILFISITPSSSSCFTSSCGQNEPAIRFPFRIEARQPSRCGYPGFTLSCGPYNETFLSFPGTTPFILRAIDYSTQQLWVNDPGNCLAGRLLNLDLPAAPDVSNSPFRGLYEQLFSFFNCSGNLDKFRGMNPIACLSSSGGVGGGGGEGSAVGYSVFATSSDRAMVRLRREPSCKMVARVMVPMEWLLYGEVTSSDLSADVRLTWDSPECRRCEIRGGSCGLKGNSSSDVGCSHIHIPRRGLPGAARYAITVGVGIPLLLFGIGALCCVFRRVKRCATSSSSATNDHHHQSLPQFNTTNIPPPICIGLDGPTIESYPKIVLGESMRLPKPEDDNTCSICLSEYNPKETLKTIPGCHHCFHAECIDEWLRLNGTCPICRNSPPPAGHVAACSSLVIAS
ncbi:Putative RING-H2 finger protein ATL21A [Linum grandiflorum]